MGESVPAAAHHLPAGGKVWQPTPCPWDRAASSRRRISDPEKQRRKGELTWHQAVGISGDSIQLVLGYNASLEISPQSVSAGGATQQNSGPAEGTDRLTQQ